MNEVKRLLPLFLAIILCFTFVGCSEANDHTPQAEAPSEAITQIETESSTTEPTEETTSYAEETTTTAIPETTDQPSASPTTPPAVAEQLPADSSFSVHFIDVGQGLAIMAKAGDDVLVYDGGNSDAASYFVSYLKEEGVEDIDYMIASHYDADHLNGLVGALHAFDTETIIAPDYKHNSKLYTSFYNTLSSQNKEVTYPEVGQEYEFGEGSFTVLGPTQIRDDSNNNSVVVRLDYGDTSFLFTGDAES